jgi:catechol 2,3-dioxygenase-like lactoylglutathione lyase family enzyme
MDTSRATVRYMIDDVAAALTFYTTHLGFETESTALPAFAAVTRGPLRLLLSGPESSGRRPMPDGSRTAPGGWNRIQIAVDDLAQEVARLRAAGLHFRNEILSGVAGSQIILDDPFGNPIELFQPGPVNRDI